MDTREAAQHWADVWKAGWEALDPEPIMALYAPEATHVTEPFRDPAHGLTDIRAYVARILGEEEDPRVWVAEPIVDGDRAAIGWWASLREAGADITLAGVSIVTFRADGLVVEQWDAWNQLGQRMEPPARAPMADGDA